MDTELLVDGRVEGGRDLLAELATMGFDIAVAFWVRADEDLWFLYIASTSVAKGSIGDAYGVAYAALGRLQNPSITLSDIRFVRPENPIAADVAAIRDRYATKWPARYKGGKLGGLPVEEAYIYPQVQPGADQEAILQTLTRLMKRTGPMQPSLITLRDGSTRRALPIGLNVQHPGGGLIVSLDDVTSGKVQSVTIDEIVSVQ